MEIKSITKNKNILAVFILFLVAVINYWRVPFLFWQQDEWVTFANLIQNGINIVLHGLEVKSTHFSPISNFLSFVYFNIFGFNYSGYLIVGLIFHLINGFLIFKIAEKITKNFFFSILAGIIFVGSSASYQLLMWPIVNLNTISLTFTLLSIILLITFLVNKKMPFFFGTIVTFFCALSLFTIEYSAGILLFIPFTLCVFYRQLGTRKITIFLIPFILFIAFYIWFRFYYSVPQNVITSSSQTSLNMIIQNTLSLPIYYLGQIFVPENIIIIISKFVAPLTDTENRNMFRVILGFSFFIILIILFIIKKASLMKFPNDLRNVLLVILFIFSSALPFLFLTGKSADLSIIPSRYLYFGSAGGALLISILLYYLKSKKISLSFKFIGGLTLIFLLLSTYQNLQRSEELYSQGVIRKSILENIKQKYPELPKKTIFYFQSDTAYYGLPSEEKIPPFQAGLGQILLVWYYNQMNFPLEFYKNEYLWNITDEDYKEIHGFGYGYFRSWDKLQQAILKYHLSPNSVIAYSWKGETNSLLDITQKIRKQLNQSSDKFTK